MTCFALKYGDFSYVISIGDGGRKDCCCSCYKQRITYIDTLCAGYPMCKKCFQASLDKLFKDCVDYTVYNMEVTHSTVCNRGGLHLNANYDNGVIIITRYASADHAYTSAGQTVLAKMAEHVVEIQRQKLLSLLNRDNILANTTKPRSIIRKKK